MCCEQLRDEAAMAEAAVVAGQVDRRAGGAEILDAGRQVGGADAVIERDPLRLRRGGSAAVAARAQQIADVARNGVWPMPPATRAT